MALPTPSVTLTAAAPTLVSAGSPSEHIYIESDDSSGTPAAAARTVRETIVLRNPVRRIGFELTLYAEGFLKVTARLKDKPGSPYFLDLRFLDPVPTIERTIASRWLLGATGCAAAVALAAFLLRFEALYALAGVALGVTSLATTTALYLGIYSSYERIEYCTLHGRTAVLALTANIGSINAFRALVPTLSRAIEDAGETIGADTAAYLRAEMREHYRLRGDRVINTDDCAAGTGRILAQFDVQA